MPANLHKMFKLIASKTRFTLWLPGLCFFALSAVSSSAENITIDDIKKIAEEGDYKKAYNELLPVALELQSEADNLQGLLDYYKKELSDKKEVTTEVVDYKYNDAANRLWSSAWNLQHDGIFKKMGKEKEETLLQAVETYRRIVIDYPQADKAEEAQYRIGRIYYKFIKDNELAAVELERYLNMYPKGKFASDAKAMLGRTKRK